MPATSSALSRFAPVVLLILSTRWVLSSSIRWWNLGNMHYPITYSNVLKYSGMHNAMNFRQLRVMAEFPDAVRAVVSSLDLAKGECVHQMRHERWNCNTASDSLFMGNIAKLHIKETAFALALVAAALTHTVAKACQRGEIAACSCYSNHSSASGSGFDRNTNDFVGNRVEGCANIITFAVKFTERIVDELDLPIQDKSRFYLRNNKVGRDVVSNSLITKCACWGITAVCLVRECYQTPAPFRLIGDILFGKYKTARKIPYRPALTYSQQKSRRLPVLKRPGQQHDEVSSLELVYNMESPDFCDLDPRTETSGTRNRRCDPQSPRSDGCAHLCCGRGHVESRGSIAERCECKFVWCCLTICENCNNSFVKHNCL